MRMGRPAKKAGKIPHLEKKGAAYYYVQGTGSRKWIPLGSDYSVALVKWAELEGRTQSSTFADLFRWYMANAKLAKETTKNYWAHGAAIMRVFGDAAPAQITAPILASYRDKLKPGNASMRLGIIKSVFAAAVEKGLATHNPARDVKRPKLKQRDRLISDDEFIAIRSKCPDWLQVGMDLAYLIGCRPGDAFRLKWSDISQDGIILTSQKTGKKTLFLMTAELRGILEDAKRLPRGIASVYVISDYRGQPIITKRRQKAWKAACEAAGLSNTHFRDIRAKTASDDEENAQARLQHSSKEMTKRYVRSMPRVMPMARKL
jgi:integrase